MEIRKRRGLVALLLVLALAAAGCADGDTGGQTDGETDIPDGPTITVGSANFTESIILGEIYAQALDEAGYPVETQLNLGAREIYFQALQDGDIDFFPEYIGSSLGSGFEVEEIPTDADEAHALLSEQAEEAGLVALDYSPGEDTDVYVVTEAYAEEHDLETISDLGEIDGTVTLGGPPECETRDTCLVGLQEVYELDNLEFQSIQEGSARVAALEQGDVDVALLFSTQPVITEKGFVPLEDDQEIISAENIVPLVREDVVEAYGDDFTELVNSITRTITTDVLLDLNGRVELEAEDPDDVAADYLEEQGFVAD